MLGWLQRLVSSSIGKKLFMALSGLGLMVFLVGHLAGNLLIYVPDEGEAFNKYAHTLESNPALPIIEALLAAVFLVHIVLAFRLTMENREKRDVGYAVRAAKGRSTFASSSMMITGTIVLIFLLIHLYDFRIQKEMVEEHDLAAMVRDRLESPVGVLIYVVGVIALTIHLSHAARSVVQSLGISHPRYNPLFDLLARAFAVLIGLGFLSFPLVLFLGGNA